MSMRRTRVKATANLTNVKRKPRNAVVSTTSIPQEEKLEIEQLLNEQTKELAKPSDVGTESHLAANATNDDEPTQQEVESHDTTASLAEEMTTVHGHKDEQIGKEATAFKMPVSALNVDEVFHSDIEDNVIQMDLQKSSTGYPMSPSKVQARQRVRPTPVFGQRRNSFVCASPSPHTGDVDVGSTSGGGVSGGSTPSGAVLDFISPGTPQRRERYYSGSSNAPSTPQMSQHKYFPAVMSPGMGRIRTESTCSAFSDSFSVSGKGRKNDEHKSNHRVTARRDFETRFNNGVPDKSTFKMFDMIYYNPASNPMEQKPAVTTIKAEGVDTKPPKEEVVESPDESNAVLVPQLKLNDNGEMIIDEKTLEIETTAEQEARKVLANSSLILMDENTGMNGFYKRQKRTRGWSAEETVRFYRSLQIVGTDFSLMCELFKNRTRRDLKLKYKKEERVNSALINKALLYPKVFDIEELKDTLEREDREREEATKRWKEIQKREAQKLYKKAKDKHSKAALALSDGDFVLDNENVPCSKLGKRAINAAANEANTELNKTHDDSNSKIKRRRRTRVEKKSKKNESAATDYIITLPSFNTIKQEANVKNEQSQQECVQLEAELTELLEPTSSPALEKQPVNLIQIDEQTPEERSIIGSFDERENTLINFDNGTLTCVDDHVQSSIQTNNTSSSNDVTPSVLVDLQSPTLTQNSVDHNSDTKSQTPRDDHYNTTHNDKSIEAESENVDENEHEVSEDDIQQILTLLAEGSLVLVSTLDPDNPDNVIHEIYEMNKDTGKLCEESLDIPENIVQCILAVMSLSCMYVYMHIITVVEKVSFNVLQSLEHQQRRW